MSLIWKINAVDHDVDVTVDSSLVPFRTHLFMEYLYINDL